MQYCTSRQSSRNVTLEKQLTLMVADPESYSVINVCNRYMLQPNAIDCAVLACAAAVPLGVQGTARGLGRCEHPIPLDEVSQGSFTSKYSRSRRIRGTGALRIEDA
eukprot:scaffold87940_cov32-Tisochrysis_lutea.AAC.2